MKMFHLSSGKKKKLHDITKSTQLQYSGVGTRIYTSYARVASHHATQPNQHQKVLYSYGCRKQKKVITTAFTNLLLSSHIQRKCLTVFISRVSVLFIYLYIF